MVFPDSVDGDQEREIVEIVSPVTVRFAGTKEVAGTDIGSAGTGHKLGALHGVEIGAIGVGVGVDVGVLTAGAVTVTNADSGLLVPPEPEQLMVYV